MKKIVLVVFVSGMISLYGCTIDELITEEEAKQMVLDHHQRRAGVVEIKSIFLKGDKYIVEWEIEPIEKGIDSVHQETGELKMIESSHGTCKWF